MNWSDLGGLIGRAAPMLGTLVGGPAGTIVGGMIASALGTEATPEAVSAAVANNPDAVVKLKQIEADHDTKLQELTLDDTKAAYADVANARDREIQVKDSTPKILAYVITAGFFGVLATLIFHGLPTVGGEALLILLGSLGTAWTAIVSYYYGSTKGSADKTALLAKLKT